MGNVRFTLFKHHLKKFYDSRLLYVFPNHQCESSVISLCHQNNGYDCGLFVCIYAALLSIQPDIDLSRLFFPDTTLTTLRTCMMNDIINHRYADFPNFMKGLKELYGSLPAKADDSTPITIDNKRKSLETVDSPKIKKKVKRVTVEKKKKKVESDTETSTPNKRKKERKKKELNDSRKSPRMKEPLDSIDNTPEKKTRRKTPQKGTSSQESASLQKMTSSHTNKSPISPSEKKVWVARKQSTAPVKTTSVVTRSKKNQ